MSLRILLNNPPVKSIAEPWYDTPDFGRAGLAYVAGFLRERVPCEIKIIDSKFERLSFEETRRQINAFEPDIVGLTAFTNEIKPAAQMAGLIKSDRPRTITVIGGVHVTALPVETLAEFPEFDFGVYGEGEVTFAEFVQEVALSPSAPDTDGIAGLVVRKNDAITINPPRERIADLDQIPFPAWDLLPGAKTYFVQVSRGCPFACKFCMNPNGKIARRRTVENVLNELNLIIREYSPTDIWYGDEIFTVDMEHTKALLQAKIEADIPGRIRWSAVTHVRFVDDELFKLMHESNVSLVGFGIETGDEETLKKIGKGTTLDLIMRAREGARRFNVPITTYMIFGQPNETIRTIRKSIDLAVRLNPDLPIFGIMVPYPGTEVARLAANGESGYRLLTRDWDAYNKQIGGALEFANLSRTRIELLQLYAYIKVFLWNFRFFDLAKFIWQFRTAGFAVLGKIARKFLNKKFSRRNEDATGAGGGPDNASFGRATEKWQEWQTKELVRLKKLNSPKSPRSPSPEKLPESLIP